MLRKTLRQIQDPNLHDRWRELAKDPKTWVEAARVYRTLFPNADLVEASRKVRAFYERS